MSDIFLRDVLADGDLLRRVGAQPEGISVADLAALLIVAGVAPLASPTFTGNVVVPNPDAAGEALNLGTADGRYGRATTVPVEDVAGTSDTIGSGDLGKILRFTNAALVTVTLPAGLAVGSIVHLLAWGAAGIAVQDDGTSTVQPEGSVAQYSEVSCVVVASDTWSVQGNVA